MIKSSKKLIFIVTIVTLAGCGMSVRNINTPSENLPDYRYFERANTSEATTKQDMRNCRLGILRSMIVSGDEEVDTDYQEMNRRWMATDGGQLRLTNNQYIRGHLCMYAKGYYRPKFGNICDNSNYKRYSACQEYLQKKKAND